MAKMVIFDPAMCCSTGVCGPSIDSELLRVSTVINNLDKNGIKIERYNLTSNPQAFVDNQMINELLNKDGIDVLPVTIVEGKIVKTNNYLTNEEFAKLLDVPDSYLNKQAKPKSKRCCCEGDCC